MPSDNLNSLFAECARYSRHVLLVQRRGYRRETWTYAKLTSVAYSAASDLWEHGVGSGDRVVLWGANSAEWMAAFWGCLLVGAVAVPMDDGATNDFVSRVVRDTSARVIFATQEKIRQFGGATRPLDPLGTPIPWLALEEVPDGAGQQSIVARSRHPKRRPNAPLYETFTEEPIT